MEKEIIIWLAGLLSTDGSVRRQTHHSVSFFIYSAEMDWMKQIKLKLKQIGLLSNVSMIKRNNSFGKTIYMLHINNPSKVCKLLVKYNCETWMINRKWQLIKEHNEIYTNKTYPYRRWTEKEIQIIEENRNKSLKELKKLLPRRTKNSIPNYLYYKKLRKHSKVVVQ